MASGKDVRKTAKSKESLDKDQGPYLKSDESTNAEFKCECCKKTIHSGM